MEHSEQLVINWHITEACNFGCKYCYAHWRDPDQSEIWHKPEECRKLLVELAKLPSNGFPPGKWDGKRLNFAGGEPFLILKQKAGKELRDEAVRLGFALSVISNGSLMTDEIVRQWAPHLQILGISMDSADLEINRRIGRHPKKNAEHQVSPLRVAEIFRLAREENSHIECKLNTVVNAHNHHEDMRSAITMIGPDRWKILRMLSVGDEDIRRKQEPLKISDSQFAEFCDRHSDTQELSGTVRTTMQ